MYDEVTHCFSCLWLDVAECAHHYAQKACVTRHKLGKIFFTVFIFFSSILRGLKKTKAAFTLCAKRLLFILKNQYLKNLTFLMVDNQLIRHNSASF